MSAGAMAMATAAAAGPPFSAWVPDVSKFWTAKDDERCPAPRSDDYKDWTLMQLKREITERQLKTNPKKRNKEAFVRILLADDEVEAADDVAPETAAPDPQQPANPPLTKHQAPTSPAISTSAVAVPITQQVADVREDGGEHEADGHASIQGPLDLHYTSPRLAKKRKSDADDGSTPGSSMATETSISGKESAEYLRHKLNIQAARMDIESRRLDMELKREQRNQDLHAVQFALAQEQLAQAKLATQKMKTEWMVDQLLQKKRLREAGISTDESASLGIF